MRTLQEEIERRRTFAIISHPDAGKTTLTEKFLLYGGAIQLAGTVKGKKHSRQAVSDWMEIEKQRGISVTSSVLQFEYDGYCINILDTPGHQDFSEDTYRTLMAADSAVMVIDGGKGVEDQTRKLFQVCGMRHIPVFTFINKMDRESKDPYDLLREVEQELGIATCAMNWPIGSGKRFAGVYALDEKKVLRFSGTGGATAAQVSAYDLDDPELKDSIETELYQQLTDDVELLEMAGDAFDLAAVRNGELSPVFFGSALNNFGVETFLKHFLTMTTAPLPRQNVAVTDERFSAFAFKIQANMNKAHRDRMAFFRICSGKFTKGMEVYHVQGGRRMKLNQSKQLMAEQRETVEEAYAGDIIGIFDPGVFNLGDTICDPKMRVRFDGIPAFAPEHFCRVRQTDAMKRKQFVKGITQIAQEGAIQIFQEPGGSMEDIIVGVVGELQFEVLSYRLKNEYGVTIRMDPLAYQYIRWVDEYEGDIEDLDLSSDTKIVIDLKSRYLLLFTSSWGVNWAAEHNDHLKLSTYSA